MPGYSFIQADVNCPFYKYDDGKRAIICEGFADNCTVSVRWRCHENQVIHLRTFCCDHYERCEVYRMILESKYAEEEE